MLGKAHMRSTSSLRIKFPQRCLWNSPNVCLIDYGPRVPRPFKTDRLAKKKKKKKKIIQEWLLDEGDYTENLQIVCLCHNK